MFAQEKLIAQQRMIQPFVPKSIPKVQQLNNISQFCRQIYTFSQCPYISKHRFARFHSVGKHARAVGFLYGIYSSLFCYGWERYPVSFV